MRKTTRKAPAIRFSPNPIPEAMTSAVITSARTDKIFSALSKAQGAVEQAVKTKQAANDESRESWNYAGLDDVMEAVRETRADNDLAVLERFPAGKAALHVILVHGSGQWIDYGTYALGDYKTHNEKTAAVTIARRVMLKCIFNVVDKGDDKDGRGEGNRPLGIGANENADAPLADDGGPRPLTDKEKRQAYQDAKDEYLIDYTVTPDGRIDFDEFAILYETALGNVKTMNDLAMLSKSNNQALLKMQEERPDLFNHIQAVGDPIVQKLL
jgi:hypothetical protein